MHDPLASDRSRASTSAIASTAASSSGSGSAGRGRACGAGAALWPLSPAPGTRWASITAFFQTFSRATSLGPVGERRTMRSAPVQVDRGQVSGAGYDDRPADVVGPEQVGPRRPVEPRVPAEAAADDPRRELFAVHPAQDVPAALAVHVAVEPDLVHAVLEVGVVQDGDGAADVVLVDVGDDEQLVAVAVASTSARPAPPPRRRRDRRRPAAGGGLCPFRTRRPGSRRSRWEQLDRERHDSTFTFVSISPWETRMSPISRFSASSERRAAATMSPTLASVPAAS